MVTCDKTMWILPIVFYFFNKYLPKKYNVTILGFNRPNIDFPENITFRSMGNTQNIKQWSKDIYNFTKTILDEYIVFLLDDFFLLDTFREDKFNEIINMMDQQKNIGLCNIGLAPQYNPLKDKILINDNDFFLFEQFSDLYQINCQPSIYRTKHFNKYFNKHNDPWELELNKNHKNFIERLICCSPLDKSGNILNPDKKQKPIYQTQLRSALSGKMFPNKLNMQGAKSEDIQEIINLGLVPEEMII